jgi:hypothetical protein
MPEVAALAWVDGWPRLLADGTGLMQCAGCFMKDAKRLARVFFVHGHLLLRNGL